MSRKLFLALLLGSLIVLAKTTVAEEAEEEEEDDDMFDDTDDSERAILLVRRSVADARPLEGKATTVTLSIYNAGTVDAKNVKLTEAAWPSEAFSVDGELAASFDSIPVGSSVVHTYKVAGKEAGTFNQRPTVVTYIPTDGESQTVTTNVLAFRTFTIVESVAAQALELGSTLTGGNFNTVSDWQRLAYFAIAAGVTVFAYKSYGSVSTSHANRKRSKALAALGELEKDN